MALYPRPKGRFYISDTEAAPVYQNGKRVFRGFGSDYSANDNIIYIASAPLERVVSLKAFVESFKLNLQKDIENVNFTDRQHSFDIEKTTEMSYDLKINMPAHSVNEAANNLAKIEELQRLIMLVSTGGVSNRTDIEKSIFVVYFKNLINCGSSLTRSIGTITNFPQLLKAGFPCFIEEINYEPDVSSGFFEHNGDLFPKNISLSLKLNYESETMRDAEYNKEGNDDNVQGVTIAPFMTNGQYSQDDSSLFPFGVTVRGTNGFAERPNEITKASQEMTQKQMNSIFNNQYQPLLSYVFISLPISKNFGNSPGEDDEFYETSTNTRTRYVLFKPFFESFSRRNFVDIKDSAEDANPIYRQIDRNGSAFKSLDYSMKLSLPAANIQEAMKNCAKIQYLIRMFIKRGEVSNDIDPVAENQDEASYNEYIKEKIMVYIPKKIEKPNSVGTSSSFSTMYKNSIPFIFSSLDIDIDVSAGFFDVGNRLFPKVMSITIELKSTHPYISPIKVAGEGIPSKVGWTMESGDVIVKKIMGDKNLHLFPFDRKTSKITIGE